MGITHWKVELSRTERHIKNVSQPCQRTHRQKIARAPAGCPTETPSQSVA